MEGDIDLTESFKDGFSYKCTISLEVAALHFLTHTKMDRYPPEVTQTLC